MKRCLGLGLKLATRGGLFVYIYIYVCVCNLRAGWLGMVEICNFWFISRVSCGR